MITKLFRNAYLATKRFMKLSMDNGLHWEGAGNNILFLMHLVLDF